jgi:hypothetical protein
VSNTNKANSTANSYGFGVMHQFWQFKPLLHADKSQSITTEFLRGRPR